MMNDLSKLRIDRSGEVKEKEPPIPFKRNRIIIFSSAVLLLTLLIIFLYPGTFHTAREVELVPVTVISPSSSSSVLNASGYVVAQRKAAVASKATGKLEYITAEEGTILLKGQIIGRLESKDMDAALAQARANWEVSRASLSEAKANLTRQKSLIESKLISQAEFDVVEAQYNRAVATVDASQAGVQAAEVAVENTFIRAPFDGTVLTKNADVGEIVAPFGSAGNSKGAVVTMADMASLQVEADVSESNIERVQVGQPCEITLDAFPEKRYRGTVHIIVPTADRAKATIMTKVRFLDKDNRVLPEMSAKVAFLSREITKAEIDTKLAIAVPPDAVSFRNNLKVVLVVKDGTIIETPVTLGQRLGGLIEITGSISAGDLVVGKPAGNLKMGMKVKIKK